MLREKKNRADRIVQIILLVLIAAGILGIIVTMGSGSAPAGPGGMPGGKSVEAGSTGKAVAVGVVEVGTADVREYIRVNGDVNSESSVNLYPDAAGELVSIEVSVGDYVRRGQTIADVDPSQPGQVYSISRVDTTISGTVTSLPYDIGETVSELTPIATIGNLTDLEIVTYVPERFVGSVNVGLKANVTLDAFPDEIFTATVTEVSPVLDASSRTVEVTLAPDARDSRIRVGMFATVRIIIREVSGVVAVPPAALTTYYGTDVVYVVENGVALRREVVTGMSSSEAVQIISGVKEGETVVVDGLSGITDGAEVRIVE